MKIKNLQINVLALLFGLTAVCFVNKTDANNATKSPEGELFFDQNGDDAPNKNQKPTKQGTATETLNWTFRGPDDAAGKVTSVVSNSSDYLTVYVGAAHNGVWKSTTGGQGQNCWSKIPVESNKNLFVTCLTLDETNDILYAGTGGDFAGQGVYKAEGNGALKLMPGTENWTHVSKIAISGNRVYAATNEGLMCYTGGAWTTCTGTKSDNPVTLDGPIKDMSINNAGLVIVAMNKVECYVSKTGSPDKFEFQNLGISEYTEDNISVAASPTDNNILYVAVAKLAPDPGKVSNIFLSEDQGDTWTPILSWFSGKEFIDPLEGNGININSIYVDSIDPYTLYVASKNIWKGKRYGYGMYDFGLSAITLSSTPANSMFYLHSNVRDVNFVGGTADMWRGAYIATDGGLYLVNMFIHPGEHFAVAHPLNKFLLIGSCDHVAANNKADILFGTPTLGVQAMDTFTNYATSARPVWDALPAAKEEISEGKGGSCVISSINERFYAYSLLLYDESLKALTLTFRRSIDNGKSFHPTKNSNPTVEWFSTAMLPTPTPTPKYDAPMVMWENFDYDHSYDTVWFKANKNTNFYEGDRTIYAPSKNFDYPIEYTVPYGFTHGDSILVPDPVQNRVLVGLNNKLFMTREALVYEKTNNSTPAMTWFLMATLPAADTILTLALSDDANTIYVGTVLGNVHCITNLKMVYSAATIELAERTLAYAFTGKRIRAMAVDPTDANHVVVVLDGGGDNVYETFNGETESATFNSIKGDLPNNVYSVLLPKGAKKGTIMAGTEKGIWTKESAGNWEANGNGMGEVPVMTLTQLTTYRPGVKNVPYLDAEKGKIRINYPNNSQSYLTIYAGTYGSGIFSSEQYVGIEEFPSNDTKESNALAVIPNPVNDIATIALDMTKGYATIQIFSIDGRCINEQTAKNDINTINFKGYAPGTYIIQVTQGSAVQSTKVIKR